MNTVMYRKVFNLQTTASVELVQKLNILQGDILASASLFLNSVPVLYLTPGAYSRIWEVVPLISDTHFHIEEGSDTIGKLLGFLCKGTPARRDKLYYGMANYEFCYQLEKGV